MKEVELLSKSVRLDTGKHRAEQHMVGRLFPFYTREPNRVKFKDPFMEIVGIITRLTLGYSNEIDEMEEKYLGNILYKVAAEKDINQTEVEKLFSFNFSDINSPYMLKYFPLQDPKSSEVKGKVLLAKYLIELFNLRENKEWINYISETEGQLTLYNKLVMSNLPKLNKDKGKEEVFHFFDKDGLLELFNHDLASLMENQSFFMSNIALFFSYYMFYYIIQQAYQIDMRCRESYEMWFTFDKESVSKGRNAYRLGYRLILDKSKQFLLEVNTLDYLNVLIGDDQAYSMESIINNPDLNKTLLSRLSMFNQRFATVINYDYKSMQSLDEQITQLKEMLQQSLGKEIQSRYARSFKEYSNLGFIRSRGRLGYMFNASQELLLLFVGVIIGSKEKMLLRDFFVELEKRGLMFDTQSRREIVAYFEKINILEKLSDSGDAQYVKSIL